MSDPFLGEIRMFGFNFAPAGWALCNGQVLPISQNTALFSLLGTIYGGDGTTNFALPNLQSRVAIHAGQGSGLSPYVAGQAAGTETVTLSVAELPAHTHRLHVDATAAQTTAPAGHVLAKADIYADALHGSTTLSENSLGNTGGGEPHTNIQPYLTLTFCIALQGVFPSRS